ncbi:MAG: nickel pincer cofactor biosynthesis protein LarB [Gemmataceae bacterium]
MTIEETLGLLQKVREGTITIEDAASRFPHAAADLGFATVDLERRARCGFPEVVFAQNKTCEWLEGVVRRITDAGQDSLATRLDAAQMDHMAAVFPTATVDRLARTFWLPNGPRPVAEGQVAVLTAGTSDLPVAREAAVTAEALGTRVNLVVDVGVAGLHRLLRRRDDFSKADVVVVVAGMDGALPSVVGGLVDRPVIAVPTSVGYGTAFAGVAPLLTMLNACSANVVSVNIDAGFKAGYVAGMIAKRSARAL